MHNALIAQPELLHNLPLVHNKYSITLVYATTYECCRHGPYFVTERSSWDTLAIVLATTTHSKGGQTGKAGWQKGAQVCALATRVVAQTMPMVLVK